MANVLVPILRHAILCLEILIVTMFLVFNCVFKRGYVTLWFLRSWRYSYMAKWGRIYNIVRVCFILSSIFSRWPESQCKVVQRRHGHHVRHKDESLRGPRHEWTWGQGDQDGRHWGVCVHCHQQARHYHSLCQGHCHRSVFFIFTVWFKFCFSLFFIYVINFSCPKLPRPTVCGAGSTCPNMCHPKPWP